LAPLSPDERQARTFKLDALRGSVDGVVLATVQSTALVIAVKYFHAPDSLTALIAAAPFIGNIFSLFYSARLATSRRPVAELAAIPLLMGSLFFFISAWMPSVETFACVVTVAIVFHTLRLTFLAAIYQQNYAPSDRGRLFSRGLLFGIVTSLLSSLGFGKLLEHDLGKYKFVFIATAIAACLSFFATRAMPTQPPNAEGRSNPLKNLGLVVRDRAFGYMVFVWSVFGFANLWVMPLRVVYLADPVRGLDLSPFTVLLIQQVVTEAARLLFTPLWGRLFDRLNFAALRIVLNAFLGIGLLLFFLTRNPYVIALGSFLVGISNAGGGIAWSLWVTRFSPARETHVYMSVHTFFTGVRGIIGPYLGFLFVQTYSLRSIGFVSCGLVVLSMLLLWPATAWEKRVEGERREVEVEGGS
jgi:MFS family permease